MSPGEEHFPVIGYNFKLDLDEFFNWVSLHAWQNSHCEAWRYKKKKKINDGDDLGKLFRKNVQIKGVC